MQLKYKDVDEYAEEVSIVNVTVADEPVPEYEALTAEETVPYVVLEPFTLIKEQL